MTTEWLNSEFKNSSPVFGTFFETPCSMMAEFLASISFDFLLLDAEHFPFDYETINNCIRATELHKKPMLVRVPGNDSIAIGQVLDAGASGIVVPRVETAEEAIAAVNRSNFPPVGSRGLGPSRATNYTRKIVEYLCDADFHAIVILQIETRLGVENLDDILNVQGIDAIMIGPGDMSVSYRDRTGAPPVDSREVVNDVLNRCLEVEMPVFIYVHDADSAHDFIQLGVSGVVIGSELMLLELGARQALRKLGREG